VLIFFLFLKRSKIDISQDVKLLSGHFECSQRNPDQRVGVKDPAKEQPGRLRRSYREWPNELATNSHNRGSYTAPFSQLMASVDDSICL
jgi:hypothetical protein